MELTQPEALFKEQRWNLSDGQTLSTHEIFMGLQNDDLNEFLRCWNEQYPEEVLKHRFRIVEKYGLLELLGEGTYGDVYRCYDIENNSGNLAIKVPGRSLIKRYSEWFDNDATEVCLQLGQLFSREAVATSRLSASENVVFVIDHDISYPYLVLEYCDSGDLTERLKRVYDVDDLYSWGAQLANALRVAHNLTPRQLIHRDLKPANILFAGNTLKIADFGTAMMQAYYQTKSSHVGGYTPLYAAPEAFDDRAYSATDIWSLGVILYQIVAGEHPFPDTGDYETLKHNIKTQPFQGLDQRSDLKLDPTPEVIKLIHNCLEKNPKRRLISADHCYRIFSRLKEHRAPSTIADQNSFLLRCGKDYHSKRDWEAAIREFNKLIENVPNHFEGYYYRGVCYYQLQQLYEAIADLDVATNLNPQFAEAFYYRGVANKKLEKYMDAISDLDKAIQLNHKFAKAYYHRGTLYKEMDGYEEAIENLDKAILLDPTFVEAYYQRGLVFKELRKLSEAVEDFSRAIEVDDEHIDCYLERGKIFSDAGEFKDALADFETALQWDSQNPDIYYHLGNSLQNMKNYEKALEYFTYAIDLKPDFAKAYNNRGSIYYMVLENHKLAIGDLNKAIELNPKFAKAYYNRGTMYYLSQKYNEAIADLDKAIDINPGYAKAYYYRGSAYYEIRKYENAIDDMDKALELDPKNSEIFYSRGVAKKKMYRYESAIYDLTKAIQYKPDYIQAYQLRGEIYKDLEKYMEAINDLDMCIDLSPLNAELYYDRSNVYKSMGQHTEALSDLDKAIDLAPDYAKAYNNRGSIFYLLFEDEKRALQDLNKAILLDPKFTKAYYNRGSLLYLCERYIEAITDLGKTIQLSPDFAKAYYYRGLAYEKIGNDRLAQCDLMKYEGFCREHMETSYIPEDC